MGLHSKKMWKGHQNSSKHKRTPSKCSVVWERPSRIWIKTKEMLWLVQQSSTFFQKPCDGDGLSAWFSTTVLCLRKTDWQCHKCQVNCRLTSHQKRSMARSLPRTHRTHPQGAAAQTGCQWAATTGRRGKAAQCRWASPGQLGCCPPWQRHLLRRSMASTGQTNLCECHNPLAVGHALHRVPSAWHFRQGSSPLRPPQTHSPHGSGWQGSRRCGSGSRCKRRLLTQALSHP